jgi:hypothetical protein
MNNYFSYENFGPMGGAGGGIGGGPRPLGPMGGAGGGIGGGPRPLGPMGHGRPRGMNYPHRYYYHHPKPRYHYNYYPYYYNNPYNTYYYPYNYYYPVVSYNDQDFCFCTDPEEDDQNQEKVCVENTCGVCIPRSFCTTCDEKITCKQQK